LLRCKQTPLPWQQIAVGKLLKWVINVISSVRRALPVCPRLRTYRCVAAIDVEGQSLHFAMQKTASLFAITNSGYPLCRWQAIA